MTLSVAKCREIVASYLDEKAKNLSSFKKLFSGSFYNGEHSTNRIRDLLAGGSTNNFAYKCLPRSDYANFIMFVENVCLYAPNPAEILKRLQEAEEDKIIEIIKENKNYLPNYKCYYDLLIDLGEETPDDSCGYTPETRQAETESHRLSKIICVGYEIVQGSIEVMGMKGYAFYIGLTMPWFIVVTAGVFIIAAYLNYSIGRDDTAEIIQRWKTGCLFKRKNGTEFTPGERSIVYVFGSLSLISGSCLVILGALSMTPAAPLLVAYTLSLFIFAPACLIFTKMAYKYIDSDGLEGIKKYFHSRFTENWENNKLKVIYEAFKLLFSIMISIVVCIATYLMLRGKAITFFSKTCFEPFSPVISTIGASITAGVKALFSISKISELLETAGTYLFGSKDHKSSNTSSEESKKNGNESTTKIFDRLKNKAWYISFFKGSMKLTAVLVHATAEAGLVKGELDKEIGSTPIDHVKEGVLLTGKFSYSAGTTANAVKDKEELVSDSGPSLKPARM